MAHGNFIFPWFIASSRRRCACARDSRRRGRGSCPVCTRGGRRVKRHGRPAGRQAASCPWQSFPPFCLQPAGPAFTVPAHLSLIMMTPLLPLGRLGRHASAAAPRGCSCTLRCRDVSCVCDREQGSAPRSAGRRERRRHLAEPGACDQAAQRHSGTYSNSTVLRRSDL